MPAQERPPILGGRGIPMATASGPCLGLWRPRGRWGLRPEGEEAVGWSPGLAGPALRGAHLRRPKGDLRHKEQLLRGFFDFGLRDGPNFPMPNGKLLQREQ
jgi:hypothetical protein